MPKLMLMAREVGITSTCKYGCKVMECVCGYKFVLHSATYGHAKSSIEHSTTGARCTCPNPVTV